MVGKATPDRGGPRKSPDGVDPKTSGWASKRTRKTQRDGHNSGVKIWSLCSVSSILSHATLQQPFRTLAIKWEVNIFLKKSSCILSSCVCRLSCVCYHCVGMYPVYICMQQLQLLVVLVGGREVEFFLISATEGGSGMWSLGEDGEEWDLIVRFPHGISLCLNRHILRDFLAKTHTTIRSLPWVCLCLLDRVQRGTEAPQIGLPSHFFLLLAIPTSSFLLIPTPLLLAMA